MWTKSDKHYLSPEEHLLGQPPCLIKLHYPKHSVFERGLGELFSHQVSIKDAVDAPVALKQSKNPRYGFCSEVLSTCSVKQAE